MAASMRARPAPPPPKSDQRKTKRLKVFAVAEAVIDDCPMRVHVLDISARGSLLHTGTAETVQKTMMLTLDGEPCPATIIWARGGRIGLEFTKAVTAAQLAAVLDPERIKPAV